MLVATPLGPQAVCAQSERAQSGFHWSGCTESNSESPAVVQVAVEPWPHSSPPCTGFHPRKVIELPQLIVELAQLALKAQLWRLRAGS